MATSQLMKTLRGLPDGILARWRFLLLLFFSAVVVCALSILHSREPSCHGHSLSQWAACVTSDDTADADRFPAAEAEVRDALVLLGTNNLPLLVDWIDWEHAWKTRALRSLLHVSPNWLLQSGVFDFMVTERRDLALSIRAMEVFRVLGPKAAPAVPSLTRRVMARAPASGRTCLRALEFIGEPAIPAIVSLAGSTNCPCRIDVIESLWAYTNSPAVREALISAQLDPDLEVRRAAIHALNGEGY